MPLRKMLSLLQQLHMQNKNIIYLPFEDTSPNSTAGALDGPAVGAPTSPSCTRLAFSCSAVWIYFMLETIQAPNFQYKKKSQC